MKSLSFSILVVGISSLWLGGCNAGSAPEPMSESQLQDTVSKLAPKDQINYIRSTPMPQAEKDRRIAEIEAKTGYKAETPKGPPVRSSQ